MRLLSEFLSLTFHWPPSFNCTSLSQSKGAYQLVIQGTFLERKLHVPFWKPLSGLLDPKGCVLWFLSVPAHLTFWNISLNLHSPWKLSFSPVNLSWNITGHICLKKIIRLILYYLGSPVWNLRNFYFLFSTHCIYYFPSLTLTFIFCSFCLYSFSSHPRTLLFIIKLSFKTQKWRG